MTPEKASEAAGSAEDARVARTRADIARAAFEVLTTEGSDAVTHSRVAELAGYSKTTLYSHWPRRFDLIVLALEAIGDMPHHEPSGDIRADLIGELASFREAVVEKRLDRVLSGMAQWASVDQMRQIRDKLNGDGQRPLRTMLEDHFEHAELEAAVSMLAGVVACPSIMFGELPDDDVIEAAVNIVLSSTRSR